jgi:hypothetical protein
MESSRKRTILPSNGFHSLTAASLSSEKPLADDLTLGAKDSLKVTLTITNGGKARRPHQAFFTITSPESGLEEAFPMAITDSGKAKIDLVRSRHLLQSVHITLTLVNL